MPKSKYGEVLYEDRQDNVLIVVADDGDIIIEHKGRLVAAIGIPKLRHILRVAEQKERELRHEPRRGFRLSGSSLMGGPPSIF